MSRLAIAVIVLWVLMIVLTVLVVLLYRQFGLIYIGSRDRIALTGLAVGAIVPRSIRVIVAGNTVNWDWNARAPGRVTMAIFGEPSCLLCARLTPQLNGFADKWAHISDLIFIEKGPVPPDFSHDVANRTQWIYAEDPEGEAHKAFDIEATPYAFAVSSSREVLSKDIGNTVRDLEGVLSLALVPNDQQDDAVQDGPLPSVEALTLATSSAVLRGGKELR